MTCFSRKIFASLAAGVILLTSTHIQAEPLGRVTPPADQMFQQQAIVAAILASPSRSLSFNRQTTLERIKMIFVAIRPLRRWSAVFANQWALKDLNIADIGPEAATNVEITEVLALAFRNGHVEDMGERGGTRVYKVSQELKWPKGQGGHGGLRRNSVYISEDSFNEATILHEIAELHRWQELAFRVAGRDSTDWNQLTDDEKASLADSLRSHLASLTAKELMRLKRQMHRLASIDAALGEPLTPTLDVYSPGLERLLAGLSPLGIKQLEVIYANGISIRTLEWRSLSNNSQLPRLFAATVSILEGIAKGEDIPENTLVALQSSIDLYNKSPDPRMGPVSIPWLFSFSLSGFTNDEDALFQQLRSLNRLPARFRGDIIALQLLQQALHYDDAAFDTEALLILLDQAFELLRTEPKSGNAERLQFAVAHAVLRASKRSIGLTVRKFGAAKVLPWLRTAQRLDVSSPIPLAVMRPTIGTEWHYAPMPAPLEEILFNHNKPSSQAYLSSFIRYQRKQALYAFRHDVPDDSYNSEEKRSTIYNSTIETLEKWVRDDDQRPPRKGKDTPPLLETGLLTFTLALAFFFSPILIAPGLILSVWMNRRPHRKPASSIPTIKKLQNIYGQTKNGFFRMDGELMILGIAYSERLVRDQILSLISRWHSGGPILSVGGGDGTLEAVIRQNGHDVMTLDVTYELSAQAKEKGVPAVQGDAHHLPIRDGSIGSLLYNESIGHLNLAKSFEEAFQVLAPGGHLLLTNYRSDPADVTKRYFVVYSEKRLKWELNKAGFLVNATESIRDSESSMYLIVATRVKRPWLILVFAKQLWLDMRQWRQNRRTSSEQHSPIEAAA